MKLACASNLLWFVYASRGAKNGFGFNPDPAYCARVATIILKENDDSKEEIFLVDPSVALGLGDEITYTTLYLAMNRQGDVFIWPCREPNLERRSGDIAATSRLEAVEEAKTRYVRVQWKSPAYEMAFRDASIMETEPAWPDKPFSELVKIAFFKSGMYIADPNHQVVKILQGRN